MKPLIPLIAALAMAAGVDASAASRADYRVIPLPRIIEEGQGSPFVLNRETVITVPEGNDTLASYASLLQEYLNDMTGIRPGIARAAAGTNSINLASGYDNPNPEAYTLTVSADGINICGSTAAGAFYGMQTLRKSIDPATAREGVEFPAATVTDWPRFAYRGAHFDPSRHFFAPDSIKTFIDMLALHNINRFHWHLTDDQGWRLEVKSRPELTVVSSTRPGTVIGHNTGVYDSIPVSGYYSHDEIRDIVRYAADRNITVIPEVDLPGHMVAALAAYPELGCTGGPYQVWQQWGVSEDLLCAGNEGTYRFIEDVLGELTDLFPSQLIHIGGDECPKERWEQCPKCQAKIKELGIVADSLHTAENQLQSHVMEFAQAYLRSKGRRAIGWDEILEGGMDKDAVVMGWRSHEWGVYGARCGHDVIMTPCESLYIDYYQSRDREHEPDAIGGYVPVGKVYAYDPYKGVKESDRDRIMGVQANLWTEYIPTFSQAQYMALPRHAALAEVQWCDTEAKDYDDFVARLPRLARHYDLQGYRYAKHVLNK